MYGSKSDRIISAIGYGITLLDTLLVFLYAISGQFSGAMLAGFAVPLAALVILTVRSSRFTLTNTIHAAFLHVLTCLFATLPRVLRLLQGYGFLAPRTVGGTFTGLLVDPLPLLLPFLCSVIGIPLIALAYYSLGKALCGDFYEWPPLEWIRTWLKALPDSPEA